MIIKIIFLQIVSILFLTVSVKSQGIGSSSIEFKKAQVGYENRFIEFLKKGSYKDCVRLMSASIFSGRSVDSLEGELKYLNSLFKQGYNLEISRSYGSSFRGVGPFGHDVNGSEESKSLYKFSKNGSLVYYFEIYFDNSTPAEIVKYFESKRWRYLSLEEIPLIKPIKQ